jgi:serine/threonine protein kinase
MLAEFQREYLVRLPLPLAQLYSRAYNAKDARGRHDNTFYLFEALVKLAAAPLVATYLQETGRGAPRVAALDRLLCQLALPSLGQWLAMLRELARHFGTRPDAASHPLGQVWEQLQRPHRDLPGVLALYRRIKNGPDGEPGGDQHCSLLQLFDALVQYRNGVFGHGAGRFESFYEKEMGPLLFPAVNEVLGEGTLDILGPRGSRLVYLTELRTGDDGQVEVGLRELVGLQGERLPPLTLRGPEAAALLPGRVAVLWPGRPLPLRLDPLLVFRESELADELLFLNRDRNGRQVEYLSYTTGRAERDRDTTAALADLLSRVTGRTVDEAGLDALADQSRGETPSVEALLGPTPPATAPLGDYEVLAELGRGGMGVVYLARQQSLGRLVALKMLPADLAGDEVALARFRREVRALARCEHPNIVKVLASGTLPDGQLFYTMEYVPGCDLEQVWRELAGGAGKVDASGLSSSVWALAVLSACDKQRRQAASRQAIPAPTSVPERTAAGGPLRPAAPGPAALPLPPLPELPSATDDPGGYVRRVVALVRDAALALQAVHDQHIVHRDVKPGNLMLTPDGTRVVLMDFGLAKGQSVSLSASRQGGLLGTLRYAAPEQLAAASRAVGPVADVRGLGVTLWELLTRRRLFADAADEKQLAARVQDDDVPRLRQVDPGLDRDLEAVVARACERRATDRIPWAGRLAEYLQLVLDGKPLPIRPPGAAELLGRWARAHKPLVGSVAAAVLVIVVTTVVAFLLISGSRNEALDLAGKNHDLAEKEKAAADALREALAGQSRERQHAQEQEGIAKDQAARADRMFNLADDAVDRFYDRVSEHPVLQDPNLLGLRNELLRWSATYYEQFIKERATEDRFRIKLTTAHLRLGEITNDIEGDPRKAIEQFKQAQESFAELPPAARDSAPNQQLLGRSYHDLGAALRTLGQHADARAPYLKAVEIRGKLVHDHPENTEFKKDLARTYNNLGLLETNAGRTDEALHYHQDALALRRELVEKDARNVEFRHDLAMSLINIGTLQWKAKDLKAARQSYEDGMDILNDLVEENPMRLQFLLELAQDYANVGNVELTDQQLDKALIAYTNARNIVEPLVEGYPKLAEARRTAGRSTYLIGRVQQAQDKPKDALESYKAAREVQEKLVEEIPDKSDYRDELVATLNDLGMLYARQNGFADSEATLQEALKHERILFEKAPQVPVYRLNLSHTYVNLTQTALSQGKPTAAAAAALERSKLWPDDPNELYKVARDLAKCVPLVGPGKKSLTPAEEAERRQYADEAMEALRQTVEHGYRDAATLRSSPDLEPLRSRKDFQELLAGLAKGSG